MTSVTMRQVSCVQLLFQLIPEVNLNLLRDLLLFLSSVARHESENRMNAENLGTLFSTHILCPRKLSPEVLQSNHQLLSKAVTFMIENAEKLFEIPEKLCIDVSNYLNKKDKFATPKNKKGMILISNKILLYIIMVTGRKGVVTPDQGSPVVNTVFTFVDREASMKAQVMMICGITRIVHGCLRLVIRQTRPWPSSTLMFSPCLRALTRRGWWPS